jgi:prophage regulatory protein
MRILSYPELRDRKGIVWSRAHIYRLMRAGRFPQPLKLGEGTTAWLEDEIDRWLARHITERDNATGRTSLGGPTRLWRCAQQTPRQTKNVGEVR